MNPVLTSLPILILYPHARCNCRCLMCDIWKDTGKALMSADALDRYLTDIRELSVRWVVFSGGEPLMHEDLFRFCGALRPLGVRTTILTTGLLLARDARRVVEHVDDVIISLDGPPAVHNRIRRVPSAFESLSQGVRAVREMDASFPISARCTIHKENHSFVVETAKTAKALSLDSISFLAADLTSEAFNRPEGWTAERQQTIALTESQIGVLEQQFQQLSREWKDSGFVLEDLGKLERIVRHYRAHLGLCAPVSPNCNAPWVSAVVEADGAVRPCFFHRRLGTVNGKSLMQVLNGPEAVQFRRDLDIHANPVCNRCVCSLNWNGMKAERKDAWLDGFSPAAPQPAFYDSELDAWVLSRYADVLAALHETRLCPVDARAPDVPEAVELDAQRRLRTETLATFSRQKIEIWQQPFRDLARSRFQSLRRNTRVELISAFVEPWSLEVALSVTEADQRDAATLNCLARKVSIASADPLNEELREAAKAANTELAASLKSSPLPMSGPAFVALSQTLPRFLANAWLALLRHRLQFERLHAESALMAGAVEELLRYAGVAQTLYRRASATFNLAGVTINRGERVVLRISSANRDPLRFQYPNTLDFSRPLSPHFALGTGLHSCAGGLLIRMLSEIATAEFVENVASLDTRTPIEWIGGVGSCAPKSLHVFMRQ